MTDFSGSKFQMFSWQKLPFLSKITKVWVFLSKWAILCVNVIKIEGFSTLFKKITFKQTPCRTGGWFCQFFDYYGWFDAHAYCCLDWNSLLEWQHTMKDSLKKRMFNLNHSKISKMINETNEISKNKML